MMKGYLTVFLSLSLSILIGFVFLLTKNAIDNAGKIRLERAADAGMNSVLGEFHRGLYHRYGLLYVDASYLDKEPSVANMENRLRFYIEEGLTGRKEMLPWGSPQLDSVRISHINTAAGEMGNSMKRQAVQYVRDTGVSGKEASAAQYLSQIAGVDGRDTLGRWGALQEQIGAMELPLILNDRGEWEEVPLNNPADAVYGLTGSDIFWLLENDKAHFNVSVRLREYISQRAAVSTDMLQEESNEDDILFLSYLFAQMGHYKAPREEAYLQYQLEYIAQGRESDYENLKAVAEKLLQWRFAQNTDYVFQSSGLYQEAWEMAGELPAVLLKPEFQGPVAESILYACAYLETLAELKCLFSGGEIDPAADSFHTGTEDVAAGTLPAAAYSEAGGISYEEYLACMLLLLPGRIRNFRTMDIMEMDIRLIYGSPFFAMDWCVERYTAKITGKNSSGREYALCRTYGYY